MFKRDIAGIDLRHHVAERVGADYDLTKEIVLRQKVLIIYLETERATTDIIESNLERRCPFRI
jgi:hypothetical protein